MTTVTRTRAHRRAGFPRLRARRGAMVLFVGVFFTSAVLLGAVTFDFGRLANLKAELQNSADAAAHAGMARLVQSGCSVPADYNAIRNQAQSYATANLAMQGAVTIDTNQVGDWNPGSSTFSALGSCSGAVDGIRVVVSRQSNGLFMSIVGVTAPRVRAGATGYRCPACGSPPIVKPILVR